RSRYWYASANRRLPVLKLAPGPRQTCWYAGGPVKPVARGRPQGGQHGRSTREADTGGRHGRSMREVDAGGRHGTLTRDAIDLASVRYRPYMCARRPAV